MQTRPIRFIHRGQVREVSGAPTVRTVLEWLREDARCTGTKEGCAEGDCGACTVMVAEADPLAPQGVALSTVNACIRFLPTLDGRALLTVEDLGDPEAPHPAQQAMVRCHGSQCGFCTPGFVMSLVALHEDHALRGTRPQRGEVCDALAGNLCRCTGYRPIVEAGLSMFDDKGPRIDRAALARQLQALAEDGALDYAAPNPAMGGRIDRFLAPRSGDELARLRLEHPQARLLAGSTDIGLWVNKQLRDVGDLLWIGNAQDLRRVGWRTGEIDREDGTVGSAAASAQRWLEIGAGASLESAWSALALRWPALREVALRFAGPPVRNAGTMGGNLANGSPIGDSAPVLMALDARLVLRRGERRRVLRLDDFYLDYMKNRLEAGEFLEAVRVPEPAPDGCGSGPGTSTQHHLRAWKISKRFDCDISALCAGLRLSLKDGYLDEVRLAFGGMAATVRRARGAEAAMQGQAWTEATLQAACTSLDADFSPLSDLRASAGYRRDAARALLRRLWLQTRPDNPLPPSATSVWSQDPGA